MPHDPRAVGGLLHQDREAVLAQRRPSSPRRLPNETCSKSSTISVPFDFFLPLGGANGAPPPGEVSYWVLTWVMRATFGHPPAEGPETYARERDPGRGSATGSRKVSPPAGPSRLTPSSPGEAKSRSREAPRCTSQLLASLTRKWPLKQDVAPLGTPCGY